MPTDFSTTPWLEHFRELFECPSLEIQLRPDWGSDQGGARSQIRHAISARTGENMNDLTRLPDSDRFNISIAHCPGVGGFALAEKPYVVGLDVEVEARIRRPIVMRVAVVEEFSASPSAAHLWAAKEASFKSLRGHLQPLTLSELFVIEWQKLESKMQDAWSFQLSLNLTVPSIPGLGVVFRDNPYIVALFCRDSST